MYLFLISILLFLGTAFVIEWHEITLQDEEEKVLLFYNFCMCIGVARICMWGGYKLVRLLMPLALFWLCIA